LHAALRLGVPLPTVLIVDNHAALSGHGRKSIPKAAILRDSSAGRNQLRKKRPMRLQPFHRFSSRSAEVYPRDAILTHGLAPKLPSKAVERARVLRYQLLRPAVRANYRRCVAMPDPQNFLDNLTNLRLVMSVSLEYLQANRDQFLKSAAGQQVRQAERSISNIRALAEQLEQEFRALETSAAQQRRPM
jgi:hypothetical protein